MEFESHQVKKLFDDLDIKTTKGRMQKKIGPLLTKQVTKHYRQLQIFHTLYQFIESGVGKIHMLEGDIVRYSIHLNQNYRLIIRPINEKSDAKSLKECETVIIEGVVDYHGSKENWLIP